MVISAGKRAPAFTAKATGDREISLSDYAGKKNVMLAFFPFVFSPVCSEQIPAYSENAQRFTDLDTDVLAVSVDSPWSQGAWVEQYGIRVPVLSDFSKKIAGDCKQLGKRYVEGIKGVTNQRFVINTGMKVRPFTLRFTFRIPSPLGWSD